MMRNFKNVEDRNGMTYYDAFMSIFMDFNYDAHLSYDEVMPFSSIICNAQNSQELMDNRRILFTTTFFDADHDGSTDFLEPYFFLQNMCFQ